MRARFPMLVALIVLFFGKGVPCARAQSVPGVGVSNWLTLAANLPTAGYDHTQFYAPHFDTGVIEWDSRIELWLPPFRDKFSWGPYVRIAGIVGVHNDYTGIPAEVCQATCTNTWQNDWQSAPGFGLQLYPFSSWRFQGDSRAGKVFGPIRLFGEFAYTDYWGNTNTWRPRNRTRAGLEYWKAVNVNDFGHAWWMELWNGLYWQSSNEFSDRYDSIILGNSLRLGGRVPNARKVSAIAPYAVLESSRSKYDRAGIQNCAFAATPGIDNPCDFYWENGLKAGAGVRLAPQLPTGSSLSRFVIYGEYIRTTNYYGPAAPAFIPRSDFQIGVSMSIGQWYK